jgi:dihydroorotate dehydrogenase
MRHAAILPRGDSVAAGVRSVFCPQISQIYAVKKIRVLLRNLRTQPAANKTRNAPPKTGNSAPMSWSYEKILRPLLFAQESEAAHNRALAALGFASRHKILRGALGALYSAPELPVELFGLNFPNPVGLAAGMDKPAAALPAWERLGFGFSELGGVTWHAQPGNPAPRMFRAVAEGALVNRMGFNNPGAQRLAEKLLAWQHAGLWPRHPVGINLGKSKTTPLDRAAEDYANSFRSLRGLADFFVVNVSSPNTPNLRQLQDKTALDEILAALQEAQAGDTTHHTRDTAPGGKPHPAPLLVKVAPDLTFDALDELLEVVTRRRLAGIVATNTTIERPNTADARSQKTFAETGGLSGRPLRARSTEVIRHLHRQTQSKLPLIGVGGIFTADDAWEKICAGASLVQVYSGLVYRGPSLAGELVRGLQTKLSAAGMKTISEAVGSANR